MSSIYNNTPLINEAIQKANALPSAKTEQSKTLTLGAAAPSTVTPNSGKVLSSVPVSIDTSVIKAENLAKDVRMLGITGKHEGGAAVHLTVASYAPGSSQGSDGDVWIVVS